MNQDTLPVTESSNLLPPESMVESQPSMLQQKTIRSRWLKYICLPSKAATYILFSAAIVGCIYYKHIVDHKSQKKALLCDRDESNDSLDASTPNFIL